MSDVHIESLSMIPQVESQIRITREKLQEIVRRSQTIEDQTGSTAKLVLDAMRSIDDAARLLLDEVNHSSTASPPADEEPSHASELSEEEY